jgi:YebC/PmpR family DNA-binding regulatory protein
MSGHSKWANIKHRKGAADAKKGKVFFKLIKEITVAARLGGADLSSNPRLRSGVAAAKAENMPKDNIDRAIKKGSGELDGVAYEEITYEGYGPGGVAILVECMTDNKVRTVAEVRYLLNKAGGNLGETNCVSWMFNKKGSLMVEKGLVDEEKLVDTALEAGAEDVVEEDAVFQVITDPEQFEAVKEALEAANIPFSDAAVTMIPENVVEVTEEKVAGQVLRLLEKLEDNDDVQNVYANFDIPDDIVERLG